MTTHNESRVVPYSPALMFQVVADVENYPKFLPWCVGLRVLSREHVKAREIVLAEMIVGYKGIRERYISRIVLDREALAIDVTQTEGPFRVLENHWKFTPEGKGTRIDVSLAYEFRNLVLNMVAGAAFGRVYARMSNAFVNRAKTLAQKTV